MTFYDGVVKDRFEGFDAYGNRDDFKTYKMEKALCKSGVLAGCKTTADESDSDDDDL